MQLAEFFIGKPGPGSVSKALISGLPIVVEHSFRTLIQEKPVARWVQQEQLGWTIKNFANLASLLPTIQSNLAEYRQRVLTLNNGAIFEVADILQQFI
jgi:1,2-diacylglycerol 3-beta-galactosyltransferase